MTLSHAGRFALPRHTLVELPPGRAYEVASASGALWLTLDNDLRDIVLEPGDAFAVDGRRRALVHALSDAVLVLREPLARPAWAARPWSAPLPAWASRPLRPTA